MIPAVDGECPVRAGGARRSDGGSPAQDERVQAASFHKRQLHNFHRTFARRRPQRQFVSNLIRFAAHIAERDVRVERRRFHRTGHIADFLAHVKQFVALFWQRFQIGGQAQAAQFLRDVADAVDAVDDFLPDVAAFVVNDGAALDAAFERDVRLVHVRAESRNARLDARRLERRPADGASTFASLRRDKSGDLFCGGNQFVRDGAEGIVRDE
jgi:hypothetical protein